MLKYDEIFYNSLAHTTAKELVNCWLNNHPNIIIHHFSVNVVSGQYTMTKTFQILYEEKENENV